MGELLDKIKQTYASDNLQIAILFFGLTFILQGFFAKYQLIENSFYIGDFSFYLTVFAFTVFLLWQVFAPARDKLGKSIQLYGLQILAMSLIFSTAGTGNPASLGLAVIMLESWRKLGQKSLNISLLIFVLFVGLDISRALPNDSLTIIQIMFYALSNLALLIVMIKIDLANQAKIHQINLLKSQAEVEQQTATAIINQIQDVLIGIDSLGHIQTYNGAALAFLDLHEIKPDQTIKDIFKFKNSEGRSVDIIKQFNSKNVTLHDDLYLKLSDQVARVQVMIDEIRTDDGTNYSSINLERGFLIIMQDVTKLKNLEDEKDEFISVVSHELRTPVAAIEGNLGNSLLLMQSNEVKQQNPRLFKIVDSAHQQSLYLSTMINDLSTLARAERDDNPVFEAFQLDQMINNMYEHYQKVASTKKLSFDLDIAPETFVAFSNQLYVKELIQNLLDNAFKYTKTGGVKLITKLDKKNKIHIIIKDTGIGISKSDQSKIFDKFYRSKNYQTRETGGTGLGLYIAAKLARKIDTYIKLDSKINYGSEFSFTIEKASKNNKK